MCRCRGCVVCPRDSTDTASHKHYTKVRRRTSAFILSPYRIQSTKSEVSLCRLLHICPGRASRVKVRPAGTRHHCTYMIPWHAGAKAAPAMCALPYPRPRSGVYISGRLALPRVASRRPLARRGGCGGGDGGSRRRCLLRRRCRGGRRLAAIARLLRPRGGALPDRLATVVPPRADVKVPAHTGEPPQSQGRSSAA